MRPPSAITDWVSAAVALFREALPKVANESTKAAAKRPVIALEIISFSFQERPVSLFRPGSGLGRLPAPGFDHVFNVPRMNNST